MHVQVRELLAKAAYHGITRTAIAKKANIAPTTFTNWKTKSPRMDTFDKASKALDKLILANQLNDTDFKFTPRQTPFLECIGKTDEKVEG